MPLSHKHLHPKRSLVSDILSGDWDPFDPFGSNGDSQNSGGGGNSNDNDNGNSNGNGNGNSNSNADQNTDDTKKEGRGQATVVQTIYKTMSKTFEGEAAGYRTVGADDSSTAKAPAKTAAVGEPVQGQEQSSSKASKAVSSPSVIRAPAESTSLGSVLAKATGEASVSPSAKVDIQPTTPLSMPSATSSLDASSADKEASSGTSAGAKAGIALGVLGGLFLVGAIVFLIFNRRKKQAQREKIDDEKMHGAPPPVAGGPDHLQAMPTSAPRISLRPVTQFLPNWNLDKRTSKGAAMALGPASAAQRGPETQAWDRPGTSQSNHPNNPFGNSAERVDQEPNACRSGPSGTASRPQDPFTANGPAMAAGAAAGVAAAGAAAGLARKTSMRKNGERGMDLTLPSTLGAVPPSPAGTEFSTSFMPTDSAPPPSQGAAAIAAAGGPATSAVHRVQLDFKPTLEDEMELSAGDLVRLLHEYDDGWALCIRLDRSQQGVVPRTCLSARPVKPRPPPGAQRPGPPINPQNGPRGPNPPQGRPMTPQGRPMTPQGYPAPGQGPRPQSPGPRYQGPPGPPGHPGGRPMSPGPNGPGPRPHSPGPRYQAPPGVRPQSPGPRAQSPGPRYQGPPNGRPQSPNGVNPRRMSPPGPSAMNPQSPRQGPPANKAVERKPVPGQAY